MVGEEPDGGGGRKFTGSQRGEGEARTLEVAEVGEKGNKYTTLNNILE